MKITPLDNTCTEMIVAEPGAVEEPPVVIRMLRDDPHSGWFDVRQVKEVLAYIDSLLSRLREAEQRAEDYKRISRMPNDAATAELFKHIETLHRTLAAERERAERVRKDAERYRGFRAELINSDAEEPALWIQDAIGSAVTEQEFDAKVDQAPASREGK